MPVLRTAVALIATVIWLVCQRRYSRRAATAAHRTRRRRRRSAAEQPEAAKVQPALIVMNASGAILADNKLTLTGMAPNASHFRGPSDAGGRACTDRASTGGMGRRCRRQFRERPAECTVSAFSKDGSLTRDAVVVLKNPNLEGNQLTFEVQVLEGDLKGADGPASVFIDIIGLPFTPLSFAGVARRPPIVRRCTMLQTHPYYGYPQRTVCRVYPPPPRCGYYPFPPCY